MQKSLAYKTKFIEKFNLTFSIRTFCVKIRVVQKNNFQTNIHQLQFCVMLDE